MTLVASWLNLESGIVPTIWTVSDSMISDTNGTLTLEGSKILELPIRCKDISSPRQTIYYIGQLGFAYAGSSLRALNTYATLSTVLTNLGGNNHQLPDAISILRIARDILKLYQIRESICELSIYGVCPKTQMLFIGSIRPIPNSHPIDFEYKLESNSFDGLNYLLLGSHTSDYSKLIDEELTISTKNKDYFYWRTPIRILNNIINERHFKDVGGGLQINLINQIRFDMYSHVNTEMMYRNISVYNDLNGMVGDCLIAINGIDLS